MKKILFTSTALVFTAGVAAADVTVSGEAEMGLKYDGTTTTVHSAVEFYLSASVETDSGVTFGASADLGSTSSDDSTVSTGTLNDPEVSVSYAGLTLTVGDIGEGHDQGGMGDIGYDGLGVDDTAEIADLGSHDVAVSYSFGDISAYGSVDSSNDDWGIGFIASFDGISFGVGFGETGGEQQTLAKVGYTSGAFSGSIIYNKDDADSGGTDVFGDAYGVEFAYTTGDVTVKAAYAENDTTDAWGVGVDYDLGGATLSAGFGEVGGTEVADLGVNFSF